MIMGVLIFLRACNDPLGGLKARKMGRKRTFGLYDGKTPTLRKVNPDFTPGKLSVYNRQCVSE